MATNSANRQNAAISLGTTPQQFEIEVNGSGFSLVSLSDNYHTALDFFYGKKPEKFA